VALLLNTDADGWWPVDSATFSIGPGGRHIVVGLLLLAGGACVVHTSWMVAVRQTVATHASWFGVLDCFVFGLSFSSATAAAAAASAAAATSAATVGYVLLVGHRSCECGNLVGQGFDLCDHCVCQRLHAVADVGCLFFLGNCCLRNPSNVLAQFIAAAGVGCLVCAFVVVFANCPTAVLLLDLIIFDEPFKIRLCFAKNVLVSFRLVFSLCHLFFFEVV
jgi:hypothetical protein